MILNNNEPPTPVLSASFDGIPSLRARAKSSNKLSPNTAVTPLITPRTSSIQNLAKQCEKNMHNLVIKPIDFNDPYSSLNSGNQDSPSCFFNYVSESAMLISPPSLSASPAIDSPLLQFTSGHMDFKSNQAKETHRWALAKCFHDGCSPTKKATSPTGETCAFGSLNQVDYNPAAFQVRQHLQTIQEEEALLVNTGEMGRRKRSNTRGSRRQLTTSSSSVVPPATPIYPADADKSNDHPVVDALIEKETEDPLFIECHHKSLVVWFYLPWNQIDAVHSRHEKETEPILDVLMTHVSRKLQAKGVPVEEMCAPGGMQLSFRGMNGDRRRLRGTGDWEMAMTEHGRPENRLTLYL